MKKFRILPADIFLILNLIFIALVIFANIFSLTPSARSKQYFDELIENNQTSITFSGKIIKDPTESTSGKLNLTLGNIKLKTSENLDRSTWPEIKNATIFTQVSPETDVQRSDEIIISGDLSAGFGTFSAAVFRPTVKEILRPEPGDLFLKFRDFFADKIKDYIPSPEVGLGLGFLLGQKSGVDQTIQDNLRAVGLTHIIVASGAHLSTLTGFSRKLFGKVSRFASLLAALLLTILFIGVTGLSASMLRAGLVTGISLLLWYVGREIHPARLIIFVAALTLIYNPSYPTDLAWLLSFTSFSAIMVLAPAIEKFFYGPSKKPGPLAGTIISSLAATLLCTPILLYNFGQVSLISILANLLILPTVSIAMGLTFLTGIFALFLPPLAALFGRLALLILDYQISVADFFAAQKTFLVEIEPNNPLVFLLYLPLIVVIFTTLFFKRKKQKNRQNY